MVNKVNKSKVKGNGLGRLEEWCSWVRKQYILYKQGHPSQLDESKVAQCKYCTCFPSYACLWELTSVNCGQLNIVSEFNIK